MRGLFSAALVLALAFASDIPVREVDLDQQRHREVASPSIDRLYTHIDVGVPDTSSSLDGWENEPLTFRLQIFSSESACGYGNVTLDGQQLPQTPNGDVLTGSGTLSVQRTTLAASWSFHCIRINGVPDSQFMKFVVNLVDGKAIQNVGFTALFRQSGPMDILNIETDLSIPDQIAANPHPEALRPIAQDAELLQSSLEDDIAELDWLRAQRQEIEYLIVEKEQAIRQHGLCHYKEDITECDSIKCIVQAVARKVRAAAQDLCGRIRGDGGEDDAEFEESDHFPQPPFRKPHSPKPPFHSPKHGKNRTCGPPKGNHTRPRRPHFPHRPLPICRYHPTPHHGKPPHYGKPPHHGKPPHDDKFYHGEGHHMPPPPGFEGSSHGPYHWVKGHHMPQPTDSNVPTHDNDDSGPPSPAQLSKFPQGHMGSPGDRPHSHPQKLNGRLQGTRHNGNGIRKTFQIIKFTAIGALFAFVIVALHRRKSTPKRRADRRARREERHRRRAYRRAVHKHAITRFLARISGNKPDSDSDDWEDKRRALHSDAEDGMSTTMTEDITQLRNAADVVGDMVSAEEGRSQAVSEPISIPELENRPLMQDFEIGSQVGDGEELPAYEDNDGSANSSVVVDGFRYTPGSSEYSPSHSPVGSVSDILGLETKS